MKKTLKTVVGAMALGSLALTGCKGGEKKPEDGANAEQPADGEGAGEGEKSCNSDGGSCGGGN